MDTIFALASARGKAGVAVVRLSGPASHAVVEALCGSVPPPRQATLRTIRWKGEVLDRALVLVFQAGASFTGEASAELHLHGSGAILRAVLRALSEQPSCRLAEPGEFTRRALEAGSLDLAQVEGLADLIDAETEAQRRQAMRVFSGAIGQKVEGWRRDLIRAAALLEATIDFADEDVPTDVRLEVLTLLTGVLADLRTEAEGVRAAERIRDGFEIAIVGAPNVGKSTLLNRLAGREAAITSELAGTTRDVIEVRMEIDGYAVTLLDTAGIRDGENPVERIGVARGMERASRADMRLFLSEGEDVGQDVLRRDGDLVLAAKCDKRWRGLAVDAIPVSGRSGEGVAEVVSAIGRKLSKRSTGAATITNERHRVAITTTIEILGGVIASLDEQSCKNELVAYDLRQALMALGSILGHVGVEDLLDQIFASFCIGK